MGTIHRRNFLRSAATAGLIAGTGSASIAAVTPQEKDTAYQNRFKLSLNAYSFNEPLRSGKTDLFQVMEFCAREGFDAIDLTGYYFPGYPAVPADDYIFKLKHKAHKLGLAISGTGIRNDFSEPDAEKRKAEISLVKSWIEVAAKLGAPVIRIFTGKITTPGYSRAQVLSWMIPAINECAAHGARYGVIVAMQNHNDFIQTADQAIEILNAVNNEWFGLVLDTGSFLSNEPYGEIEKTANYAVNWQVKEKLTVNGLSSQMDLDRLFRIIVRSDYRGYLPIETLSPGDPFRIVPPFLQQVRKALTAATSS
jgi:sugar phosphate isomerase/epimerase